MELEATPASTVEGAQTSQTYTQHVKSAPQAVLPGIIKGTGTGLPSDFYYGKSNDVSGEASRVAVFWDFENCPPPTY